MLRISEGDVDPSCRSDLWSDGHDLSRDSRDRHAARSTRRDPIPIPDPTPHAPHGDVECREGGDPCDGDRGRPDLASVAARSSALTPIACVSDVMCTVVCNSSELRGACSLALVGQYWRGLWVTAARSAVSFRYGCSAIRDLSNPRWGWGEGRAATLGMGMGRGAACQTKDGARRGLPNKGWGEARPAK